MSNTMGGFGNSANNLESQIGRGTATSNLNLSIGGSGSGSQGQSEQQTGATNSDLNKRLAEMKAKLQALKKK
jgi:hypothetical protein